MSSAAAQLCQRRGAARRTPQRHGHGRAGRGPETELREPREKLIAGANWRGRIHRQTGLPPRIRTGRTLAAAARAAATNHAARVGRLAPPSPIPRPHG